MRHRLMLLSPLIALVIIAAAAAGIWWNRTATYTSPYVSFRYPTRDSLTYDPEAGTILVGGFLTITEPMQMAGIAGEPASSSMGDMAAPTPAPPSGATAVKLGSDTFYRASGASATQLSWGSVTVSYPSAHTSAAKAILASFHRPA
jgi:hypothetical protein